MNHQLCVLLYSKYSPKSQQLMNTLQSAPVDLGSTMGLTLVCVDNEDIRSKIQTATSVEVNSVPTVLLVYNNGGVEKYEGERAFMWADQTIKQLAPPPQAPSLPPQAPTPPPPAPAPPVEKVITEAPSKVKKSRKKKKITEIEDLDSESEEENELPKPPPVGVRSGAGEYEISQAFGERQDQNRDLSSRTSSSNTDLMSLAQAMQKEREQSSSKGRRSG